MLKWSCLKSAADMRANDRGHVAVIFALSILPVVAIAGFALDFQQTTTRKVKVQAAVDAAVIAGARAMQAGKSDDEIRTEIKTYINNMVNADGATFTCNQPTISFPQGSQDISVDILCSQETTLSAVMGRSEIDFLVSSTSTWGIAKLDVAFMLDVSGSMNGSNRLTNLKNSTKEAIEVLLPEDAPAELIENTRIAMSTYNSMVDAGDFFEDVTGVPKTRTYTHQIGSDVSDVQEGEFDDNFRVLLWDADNDQLIAEIGDDSVVYVAENQRDDISITVEPRSGGNFSNSDVESMYLQLSGEVSKNQTENYAPYASFGDNNGNLHGEEFDFGDYEFRYRVYEN
ncbi:MAG: pilus assembly protein TadG-related protein, partial [Pseudomonadota bacterium]